MLDRIIACFDDLLYSISTSSSSSLSKAAIILAWLALYSCSWGDCRVRLALLCEAFSVRLRVFSGCFTFGFIRNGM